MLFYYHSKLSQHNITIQYYHQYTSFSSFDMIISRSSVRSQIQVGKKLSTISGKTWFRNFLDFTVVHLLRIACQVTANFHFGTSCSHALHCTRLRLQVSHKKRLIIKLNNRLFYIPQPSVCPWTRCCRGNSFANYLQSIWKSTELDSHEIWLTASCSNPTPRYTSATQWHTHYSCK